MNISLRKSTLALLVLVFSDAQPAVVAQEIPISQGTGLVASIISEAAFSVFTELGMEPELSKKISHEIQIRWSSPTKKFADTIVKLAQSSITIVEMGVESPRYKLSRLGDCPILFIDYSTIPAKNRRWSIVLTRTASMSDYETVAFEVSETVSGDLVVKNVELITVADVSKKK